MRDLLKIVDECIKKLKDIGIPVQDDKINEICIARIKGLGKCLKTTDDKYYIKLSTLCENDAIDMNELYATILHELIHTCDGCMDHGNKWLQYAQRADVAYHYEIVGYKSVYDIKHKEKPVLGRMKCTNCIGYWNVRELKAWKQILNGEKCYCGWCNSEMIAESKMPNGEQPI